VPGPLFPPQSSGVAFKQARGCDVAIADLDGNGTLQLVLAYAFEEPGDNRAWLRVGTITNTTDAP
jgi:hypothetical protein